MSVLASKPPTTKGARSRERHPHSLASYGCEVHLVVVAKDRQVRFGGGSERDREEKGRHRKWEVCVCVFVFV